MEGEREREGDWEGGRKRVRQRKTDRQRDKARVPSLISGDRPPGAWRVPGDCLRVGQPPLERGGDVPAPSDRGMAQASRVRSRRRAASPFRGEGGGLGGPLDMCAAFLIPPSLLLFLPFIALVEGAASESFCKTNISKIM